VSAAFYGVFAVFVVLLVGLVAISIRWAIGRDRVEREARRKGATDTERDDGPARADADAPGNGPADGPAGPRAEGPAGEDPRPSRG